MRRLTVDDVVRIATVEDLRVSGSGDVAYAVSRGDPDSNRVVTEIRIRWRSGGESVLAGEKDSSPRWSPSGTLAFTSRRGAEKREGGSGVFVWGGRGEPRRVAWFKHGVSGLEWLDDRRLVAAVWEPVHELYDEEGDYVVTDRLPLWFDGRGLVAGLGSTLYLVDSESGSREKLVSEPVDIWALAACRGSVYYAVPRDWRRPHIHDVVEVSPGGRRRVVASGFMVSSLLCSSGRLYAVMNKLERGLATHNKLWLFSSGEAECLTCSLDRNVHLAAGEHRGSPVFAYADHGAVRLAALETGAPRLLVGDAWVYTAHAGGGVLAYAASTASTPQEVYVLGAPGPSRISSLNKWLVDEVELYEPLHEVVRAGGDEVEGWVLLPHGDGPHPGILYIHGGPKGMYGQRFHPEMQLMVSEGFAVFYANPRGSDGYSEEFADIRGSYGSADYEQLVAFTRHVVSRHPVDASRLAASGISYGGYLASVIASRPAGFKAVVSENGIADWVSDYWSSDIGYWFDEDQLGGSPGEKLGDYVEASPFYRAGKTSASALVVHSLEDYRCPVGQSLAMHAALSLRGVDSTLVVFRRGSHTHAARAEPRHRAKRYELKIRWLKEKLGTASVES